MKRLSVTREMASARALVASFPLEGLVVCHVPRRLRRSTDAVILIHRRADDRTNLVRLPL